MHKTVNFKRLFSEELRYQSMTEEDEIKIQNFNEILISEIEKLISNNKHEKALKLFINKGRDIPRGEKLFNILERIDSTKIKSNQAKLILSAQKITNKFCAKDYKYVLDNSEKLFNQYNSLLKYLYHDISARILIYCIECYKAQSKHEVAKIKLDEYISRNISCFAKGSLLIEKYEIEKDLQLLERAFDMYLQSGFISDAVKTLSLYANKISLKDQKKLAKTEIQLETLAMRDNDASVIYSLSCHYYGLIIKYKDMKEYQTALDYAVKIIKMTISQTAGMFKDIIYRTFGVLGELCEYLNIDQVDLDGQLIKIHKNKEEIPDSAKVMDEYIYDPYGHWEIQQEICVNKNFEKFNELEEKFKNNDYALSILYLRYAEHNETLNYVDRIGYLDQSLNLVKEYEYFDQQRAHIYKVYANIFLENNDLERYYKYANEYLNIIVYDADFNSTYLDNIIKNQKWELLEKFAQLSIGQSEDDDFMKFLLAAALYKQNKDLNKALTLFVEVQDNICGKHKNDLNTMKKDLLERKCEINFDLTKNQIKETVTLRIFEEALDEYISYVESNLRKDYAKFNKEKQDYDWVSKPEEKCKKDLKLFLDTKFKGQIKAIEEVSTGAGYIDLYITFKDGLEIIIELKMCGGGYTSTYAQKGINQLKHYLHNKQSKIGYLIVYDSRKRDFGQNITPMLETQKYFIQTKFIDMRMDTQT